MNRFFLIAVLSLCALVPAACNQHRKPIWEKVKLVDLATPTPRGQPDNKKIKTANFDVYVLQLPAENIAAIDSILRILHTSPLKFNNQKAFKSNLFSAAVGKTEMTEDIENALVEAGAENIETISLLLLNGEQNYITAKRLYYSRSIFYISQTSPAEGISIGPGTLALRIKAEQISGSRGICLVTVVPVSPEKPKSKIDQLAAREDLSDFVFASAGFQLKMSTGDFFLLAPTKYTDHQFSLAAMFFCQPEPKPAIRVYVCVCTGVNY